MNLNWAFPVLMVASGIFLLASGAFLMLWMTRFNRKIFSGQETSLQKYFVGSALNGACVFLISVGVILLAGLADKEYAWSRFDLIWIVILGFIGGIFIMIGSLWSFFIAGKFRGLLYQKLKERNKK